MIIAPLDTLLANLVVVTVAEAACGWGFPPQGEPLLRQQIYYRRNLLVADVFSHPPAGYRIPPNLRPTGGPTGANRRVRRSSTREQTGLQKPSGQCASKNFMSKFGGRRTRFTSARLATSATFADIADVAGFADDASNAPAGATTDMAGATRFSNLAGGAHA
ncbi:hypothetical protein OAN307_c01880 [Octadecabacter antarcticus 307]|uniref:Uncharacterized protein n=2 Tax=Octadecabacter TaxID=53945 RepID=M9R887_9RHOB|nr:hypothetical protein OAN307_c01880 [Octadecabacter antarcticus 307]